MIFPIQLKNLTASLVLLHESGVDPARLQKLTPDIDMSVPGRFEWKRFDQGWLVDDSYNANPGSFCGVLDSIRSMHPNKPLFVIAGPMAELGQDAEKIHHEMGQSIRHSGSEKLFVLGGILGEGYLNGWIAAGGSSDDMARFETMEEMMVAFKQCWNRKGIF